MGRGRKELSDDDQPALLSRIAERDEAELDLDPWAAKAAGHGREKPTPRALRWWSGRVSVGPQQGWWCLNGNGRCEPKKRGAFQPAICPQLSTARKRGWGPAMHSGAPAVSQGVSAPLPAYTAPSAKVARAEMEVKKEAKKSSSSKHRGAVDLAPAPAPAAAPKARHHKCARLTVNVDVL